MAFIFVVSNLKLEMNKPCVFYFNPTCELAVANGSFSYMPPLLLQEMERDLAVLPFVFGTSTDFVWTENPPTDEFSRKMQDSGFEMPVFAGLAQLESLSKGTYAGLCPWGWSPAAHFKLKNLKSNCSEEFKQSPVFEWKEEHQLLFERSTSLDVLSELVSQNRFPWLIESSMTGKRVTGFSEIELLLEQHQAVVLKAPLSSSGRGIQIIRRKNLNNSNKQWISGILKQQKYLIAEPFLEKLSDLSFQFQVKGPSDLRYLGYSLFETNANGQYRGTLIHPDLKHIPMFGSGAELEEMIQAAAETIRKALVNTVYSTFYRGFLGVDALLFSQQGKLMIQPCIEINCRMNMGILTMLLESKIHPDAVGKFELYYGSTGEYSRYAAEQIQQNQPVFQNGKIRSGFLSLVEPDQQKKFGAYISLAEAR